MSAAERVYALLLRAYPASFRAAYGGEMVLLFRDQLNERLTRPDADSAVAFWAAALWDVTRSAPALRLDALRDGWRTVAHDGSRIQPEGRVMTGQRAVAVVAVVGGLIEMVNAGLEAWAARDAARGAGWAFALVLLVVLGLMLVVAGIALLRRGAGATRFARILALGCLVLVLGIQFAVPFLSVFGRLIGIAVPVALLLVRGRSSGDRSMPAVA